MLLRLENQVCFPLYAASRLVTQLYQPLLEALDLTYPQYIVLLVLWADDGRTVQQLGDKLHLDSGTLTPLLKRMQEQGLIERRRRTTDERVVESWLTPAGKALKKRAGAVPVTLVEKIGLPLTHLKRLKRELDGLIAALSQQKKESSDEPTRTR